MMITLDQPASHPTHCHHLAGRDGDEGDFTNGSINMSVRYPTQAKWVYT